MQRIDSNTPNTRARVEARRQSRKTGKTGQEPAREQPKVAQTRQRADAPRRARKAGQREAHANTQAGIPATSTRRHFKETLTAQPDVLKRLRSNTQARMRHAPAPASQVRPGPRRVAEHWLTSGRLFSMLLFLASVGALVYLFTSPHFNIQEIDVEGNSVLDQKTVAELSGLRSVPIWFVRPSRAIERVLQNAYVEDVSIDVALPNQAIISISERSPEIRWAIGGVQYLVDASGRVLDVAQEPPTPGTLVIIDTSSQGLQPMDHIDSDAMELARTLALRLPTELQFTPAMIGWDIGLGVYVKTESGQTIVFGRTDNIDRKLAFLRQLLEDGTAFTYLDLRPSNPYYRAEGGG